MRRPLGWLLGRRCLLVPAADANFVVGRPRGRSVSTSCISLRRRSRFCGRARRGLIRRSLRRAIAAAIARTRRGGSGRPIWLGVETCVGSSRERRPSLRTSGRSPATATPPRLPDAERRPGLPSAGALRSDALEVHTVGRDCTRVTANSPSHDGALASHPRRPRRVPLFSGAAGTDAFVRLAGSLPGSAELVSVEEPEDAADENQDGFVDWAGDWESTERGSPSEWPRDAAVPDDDRHGPNRLTDERTEASHNASTVSRVSRDVEEGRLGAPRSPPMRRSTCRPTTTDSPESTPVVLSW